jgi:hypothetical protein
VSETGAVIDIVGTEHRAGKLAHQVVLLIGAASRAQHPEGVGTMLIFNLSELAGDQVEGLSPGRFLKLPVFLDQRRFQAVIAVDELVAEPPLDA